MAKAILAVVEHNGIMAQDHLFLRIGDLPVVVDPLKSGCIELRRFKELVVIANDQTDLALKPI